MDGTGRHNYLVEWYLPGATATQRRQMSQRLARAAEDVSVLDGSVLYLGSTFVPTEESCFARFESATERAVRRVLEAADVPYARVLVVEAFTG